MAGEVAVFAVLVQGSGGGGGVRSSGEDGGTGPVHDLVPAAVLSPWRRACKRDSDKEAASCRGRRGHPSIAPAVVVIRRRFMGAEAEENI